MLLQWFINYANIVIDIAGSTCDIHEVSVDACNTDRYYAFMIFAIEPGAFRILS